MRWRRNWRSEPLSLPAGMSVKDTVSKECVARYDKGYQLRKIPPHSISLCGCAVGRARVLSRVGQQLLRCRLR